MDNFLDFFQMVMNRFIITFSQQVFFNIAGVDVTLFEILIGAPIVTFLIRFAFGALYETLYGGSN